MEFIKPDINYNFIGNRKVGFVISAILIIVSIASVVMHGGLNLGVDFVGGSVVQITCSGETTNIKSIKKALKPMNFKSITVQKIEELGSRKNSFLIRVNRTTEEASHLAEAMRTALEKAYGPGTIQIDSSDMVGPLVGSELSRQGRNAIIAAIVCIFVYITLRFDMKFALGAIVALLHDIIITVGALSIANREFNLTIIAALLTVVGYSINDTVVVYDRLRENLRRSRKKDFSEIVNRSINETLSRTVLTSMTTLFVLICIFVFGGGAILNFAFAMIAGVAIGTYSSIFVASPAVVLWEDIVAAKAK